MVVNALYHRETFINIGYMVVECYVCWYCTVFREVQQLLVSKLASRRRVRGAVQMGVLSGL